MPDDTQQTHQSLRLMTGPMGALTTFVATFITLTLLAWLGGPVVAVGYRLLASLVAALLGALLAAWVGLRRRRRLSRLLTVSDAWQRGNLSVRAGDATHDGVGDLARQLDGLMATVEEDEQDLDRLRESNARLTDQVRALALVEERNRLARELHDTVKQHLFSLSMTAGAVRTRFGLLEDTKSTATPEVAEAITAIGEMIVEIETSARAAQHETTRLIEDLRPAPLQEQGLTAALNDYALLFGAQQHLLVYVDAKCGDKLLSPVATENLYRVVQEALHNVARHAHATRVDIRLRCETDRVTLTVQDNGVGFDTRLTRKGLGIGSMEERMLSIGGRLNVESIPGAGTTVIAEVDRELPGDLVRAEAGVSVAEPLTVAPSRDLTSERAPRPEAWGWLGERLVIPVGQVWPWLPAHQARYLRSPIVGAETLTLRFSRAPLGLRRIYRLRSEGQGSELARISRGLSGYNIDIEGEGFLLRGIRGLRGRAVLEQHEQALAAMQYRGRQMDTWTEVVYDDRSYQLHFKGDGSGGFVLRDSFDRPVLEVQDTRITILSALPLPLIAMVMARVIDESAVRQTVEGQRS